MEEIKPTQDQMSSLAKNLSSIRKHRDRIRAMGESLSNGSFESPLIDDLPDTDRERLNRLQQRIAIEANETTSAMANTVASVLDNLANSVSAGINRSASRTEAMRQFGLGQPVMSSIPTVNSDAIDVEMVEIPEPKI
jgi:hypothetical protein